MNSNKNKKKKMPEIIIKWKKKEKREENDGLYSRVKRSIRPGLNVFAKYSDLTLGIHCLYVELR